jgi:anti-anti-sigma factor
VPGEPEAHLISISRIRRAGDAEVSVLRLRGAVRTTTAEELEQRLSEAGERSPYLVVDLSELDYVTSTGLGHLLTQAAFQERRHGWLRVVSPSSAVAMIFELSGVGESLQIFGSEERALDDLVSRAA